MGTDKNGLVSPVLPGICHPKLFEKKNMENRLTFGHVALFFIFYSLDTHHFGMRNIYAFWNISSFYFEFRFRVFDFEFWFRVLISKILDI